MKRSPQFARLLELAQRYHRGLIATGQKDQPFDWRVGVQAVAFPWALLMFPAIVLAFLLEGHPLANALIVDPLMLFSLGGSLYAMITYGVAAIRAGWRRALDEKRKRGGQQGG